MLIIYNVYTISSCVVWRSGLLIVDDDCFQIDKTVQSAPVIPFVCCVVPWSPNNYTRMA